LSQRGNPLLRKIDAALGPLIIALLGVIIRGRGLFSRRPSRATDTALVVCFGAIGDLLLLAAVAQRVLTDSRLILACTPENRLAAEIFPELFEEILVVRLTRPWSLLQAARRLQFGHVYDSTQWANASAVQCGLLKLARPQIELRGFATDTNCRSLVYDVLVTHSASRHETQNFAALLGDEAFDPDRLVETTPVVGLNVALHLWPSGARSHLKEWPQENWRELAIRLQAHGCHLFITGSPADKARNDAFIQAVGAPMTNLAGVMKLGELFEFLRREVTLCVSVNTGTMHLAALAGTAVVALNGPTDPIRWGPVGVNGSSLLPAEGRSAYLNYGFEYPESDDEAYSLDKLSVDSVWAACRSYLPVEQID
jgi:ADP-heptose:LPS heptosyltransferase